MCGIVYAQDFSGKPVNNEILQRFDQQRSRGTQGFGLFDGQKLHMVHATKEDKILKWLVKYDSNIILFHHRYPSSTINIKRAAHPFSTKKYFSNDQYILIHNGHILNSIDLYERHQDLGIKYHSRISPFVFNDSEALLWDFALAMQNGDFSLNAYGANAFICIKLFKGKLDKLYFGRNGSNPLRLKRDKTGIVLSSEGEGELIDTNVLYTWNYKTRYLTKKHFYIPSHTTDRDYNQDTVTGDVISQDNLDWFGRKRNKLLCMDNQVQQTRLLSDDDILEEMESFVPPQWEVRTLAWDYLNIAEGKFDDAYFSMEADYIELESKAQNLLDYKQLRILELAMSLISTDKEYVNEDSVAKYWLGKYV